MKFLTIKQESQLLILQGSYAQPMILDTETLTPRIHIANDTIRDAAFVNSDSELLVADNTAVVSWLNIKDSGQSIATLTLDSNVKRVVSDLVGRYSAILTQNTLYFIDNSSHSLIKSLPYKKSSVYGMSMLTDKIIISRSGAIDYIQFSNLVGSSIKVGYQILSKDLLAQWIKNNGNMVYSTTLSYLLQAIGEEDAVSSQFADIDVEWLPSSARTISEVNEVKLSGYYRSDRISLYKTLQ